MLKAGNPREESSSALTLVIPTKNRAPFLRRALGYYARVRCPYPILVGDSSGEEQRAQVSRMIRDMGSRLRVQYVCLPSLSQGRYWQSDASLATLLEAVQTPYAAFYADDDFAVVSNFPLGLDFLQHHPDYAFVCGRAILFFLSSGEPHGTIQAVEPYPQRGVEREGAAQRLEDFFQNYRVLEYGISRTAQIKERFRTVLEARVGDHFGELLHGGMVVLQGKAKVLEALFLARQAHPGQFSARSQDVFDWVTDGQWSQDYERLHKILTQMLSDRAGLQKEKAILLVKRALWLWLGDTLETEWRWRYGSRDWRRSGFALAAGRVSGLQPFWRTIRSFLPGESNEVSLKALLRFFSRYRADFLPIHEAVARRPAPISGDGEGFPIGNSKEEILVAGGRSPW